MADNTLLNVRMQLRYDTYSHWMNSEIILLPGEIAIATFPGANTIANTDAIPENTPPSVGIKIGDGHSWFYELPWLQAVAGDVYSWAKTATKPIYTANEIGGLAEFVAAHSSGSGGGSGVSGSAYQIVWDSASSKYILQYYDDDDEEWKNTSSNIDFSDVLGRLNNIERWANGAKNNLGNIELPITALIQDEVNGYINRLDVNDTEVAHQFVTEVKQVDGKIQVTRKIIKASDITEGVFTTAQGGTGLSRLDEGEIMVGSQSGAITTKTFVTTFDGANRAEFATVGAIIDYVTGMTSGLTGAMHFVGEATVTIDTTTNSRVNPQIQGYDFGAARAGDVILANNHQEYVWTGSEWRLLGDEGSYAIKGSIVNADIADGADIDQSKIEGLADALAGKVSIVEGKGLSTNDFDDEYKDKLDNIEAEAQTNVIEHILVNNEEVTPRTINGQAKSVNLEIPELSEEDLETIATAQANVIEHILVNGTEVQPRTINNTPKSVNIEFTPFTTEEKEKLGEIEAQAQKNKVEKITINNTEYTPDANKNISITIDQAALNLDVITGARVPGATAGTYEDVDITSATKQLELSRVAKTGYIHNLNQESNSYIVLYCGTSTDVI